MFNKVLIPSLLLFFTLSLTAQKGEIKYEDYTYSADIKSVKFSRANDPLSQPIVNLDESARLYLSFDDMLGGYSNFFYEIIHCDKDWNRSDIFELEYLDGFNGEDITEYRSSTSLRSNYTHYNLTIPNEDCGWTISGNYILAVYDEQSGDPIITRRFIVTENKVSVSWISEIPQNVLEIKTNHALDIVVNYKEFRITNPLEDVYITVVQNGNWNSAVHSIRPKFTVGDEIRLNAFNMVNFPALKEFRNFDIRSIKSKSLNTHSIEYLAESTNVLLELGTKRAGRNFLFDYDTNGDFLIANADYRNGSVSSEYVNVIFSLKARYEYDEDVYIVGGLTDWKAYEEFKMEWDDFRSAYFCTVPLKQGRYDYMYALKKDELLDMDTLEGSSFETENNYTVLVYFRHISSNYDRVIGYLTAENSSSRR